VNFTRISWIAGCTALVTFPLSISLSQAGVVIAAAAWMIARRRKEADAPALKAPLLLKLGLAMYAYQLLILVVHAVIKGNPDFILQGIAKETKDVFLISMAFWVYAFSEKPEREEALLRFFRIGFIILIASGLIALFSKWRLSNIPYHLTHGWEGSMHARYQHHAGTFLAGTPLMFHIYIPVGFLHSHLTFGALLMMLFPVLFLRTMDPVIRSPASIFTRRVLGAVLVLALVSFLFLINNARSAIVGMVFATSLATVYYSRYQWGKKSLLILIPALAALGSFLLLFLFRDSLHERLASLISALSGQEKHTDYQRVLLWHAAREFISQHWLIGAGAGHFQPAVEKVLLAMSQAQPGLWFANETLQRGHAHSDLLHSAAISGLGGLALYCAFFLILIWQILKQSPAGRLERWKFGAAGMLMAGLYQCYMLDDAVLLPFWILVGFVLRAGVDRESIQSGP
jgi:O-antigen ligase